MYLEERSFTTAITQCGVQAVPAISEGCIFRCTINGPHACVEEQEYTETERESQTFRQHCLGGGGRVTNRDHA